MTTKIRVENNTKVHYFSLSEKSNMSKQNHYT